MSDDLKQQLKAQERHYFGPTLHLFFAWAAIALLGSVLWSIMDDYWREWKGYQRRFNDLEVARLKQEIGKTQQEIDADRRAVLEAQEEEARVAVSAKSHRIQEIDTSLSAMANDLYLADQNFRFTKALLDAAKYEYEEATRHHPGRVEKARAEMERFRDLLARYDDENKALQARAEALRRERRELTAQVDTLRAELQDLDKEVLRLGRSLERLDRPFTHAVLNAPMLDFINPTLKIKQTVTEGLLNDINFMSIPRVDRCQTCHLGIDRPEYVGEEQPFRVHRNLELIGSAASPHPFDQVGCTICHMGRDRGTGFVEAAHTPDGKEERQRWEEEHHYHRMHHWDHPMLASRYVEAGCLQCHMGDVFIPGAEKLSRGRELFENLGCHGCHKVAGWEDLRKVGPPLDAIATKTDPDWVKRWLADPRNFRPTTRMPRFWFLGNSSEPEDRVRNNVEIEGVVEYLFEHSRKGRYPDPPRGDAAAGKKLVEEVGCHGCHSAIGPEEEHTQPDPRSHGPNLMRLATKTYPGWMYQWVRNPKNYWDETAMPDLRLTEEEAADVAAYLASLGDESWRQRSEAYFDVPAADMARVRDNMVLGYLSRKQTTDAARDQLAGMSVRDKRLMVGERTIARYGCFGCHSIPGFENAQRIGTELTTQGSKYVDRLDFGFVDIPRERDAWFYQKLKDPRIFDQGKVKVPDEKLKMPDFGLTDQEAEELVTVLMGLRAGEVAPSRRKQYAGRNQAIQDGWRLVRTYNCTGCHLVEERGGDIQAWIQEVKGREGIDANEALAFAPPNLHTQGAKVQSDWLFRFLKNVEPIRPWLEVRMPSFHFSDEQVNSLTTFFAALEEAEYPFQDYRSGFTLIGQERALAEKLTSRDYLDCLSCHQVGERKPLTPPDSWAPDLVLARQRLRVAWIRQWLQDPQAIMPGTRMPSFFADENSGPPDILGGDEGAQMDLLARWVMSLGDGRPAVETPLYLPPPPVPLQRPAAAGATP